MYLPEIFKTFLEKHQDIADAYRKVGDLCSDAGPIDLKTQHLIQLGVSVGANSKGAVVRTREERWMQGPQTAK